MLLFPDDIVLSSRLEWNRMECSLEHWRGALEDRGLRLRRKKTEYLWQHTSRDSSQSTHCLDELEKKSGILRDNKLSINVKGV